MAPTTRRLIFSQRKIHILKIKIKFLILKGVLCTFWDIKNTIWENNFFLEIPNTTAPICQFLICKNRIFLLFTMITRLSHTEYPGSSPFTIPNKEDHVLWGERRAPKGGHRNNVYIYSIIININSTTVVNPGILIKENAYLSHKTPWQCSDNIIN